jgi:trehalose 6-phosphate phosphatase
MHLNPKKIHSETNALFLDVDGTLLEIKDRPEDVRADTGLIALLEQLLLLFDGAMALVSGRSIEDIDRIFNGVSFPAVGAHGAELRQSSTTADAPTPEPLPDRVLERLHDFIDRYDGLQLEQKQGGVSLHYRRAPELHKQCRSLVQQLMLELGPNFRLIEGKMVFEIAPQQHNKGEAIRQLLEAPAFSGRQPVFIGDDVTDEDGFVVVNAMRGLSIRVGEEKPTAARYMLNNVGEVRDLLQTIVELNNTHLESRRTHGDNS